MNCSHDDIWDMCAFEAGLDMLEVLEVLEVLDMLIQMLEALEVLENGAFCRVQTPHISCTDAHCSNEIV